MATIIQIYDILQKALPKEDAKQVADYIEDSTSRKISDNNKHLATKADMSEGFRKLQWSIIVLIVPLYAGLIALVIAFFSLKH